MIDPISLAEGIRLRVRQGTFTFEELAIISNVPKFVVKDLTKDRPISKEYMFRVVIGLGKLNGGVPDKSIFAHYKENIDHNLLKGKQVQIT